MIMLKKLATNEDGAALTEYAILTTLIGVLSIGAVISLGDKVNDTFTTVTGEVTVDPGVPIAGNPTDNNPAEDGSTFDPEAEPAGCFEATLNTTEDYYDHTDLVGVDCLRFDIERGNSLNLSEGSFDMNYYVFGAAYPDGDWQQYGFSYFIETSQGHANMVFDAEPGAAIEVGLAGTSELFFPSTSIGDVDVFFYEEEDGSTDAIGIRHNNGSYFYIHTYNYGAPDPQAIRFSDSVLTATDFAVMRQEGETHYCSLDIEYDEIDSDPDCADYYAPRFPDPDHPEYFQ
jgi:Flp pilus assembly pilin Flp